MMRRLSLWWRNVKLVRQTPEFPTLHAKISMWIATPLILFSAIIYAQRVIVNPASQIVTHCLSIVGVTLAFSAICAQLASVVDKEYKVSWVFTFAAEQFLHSALLLIQTLFIAFTRDSLITFGPIVGSVLLKKIVEGISFLIA